MTLLLALLGKIVADIGCGHGHSTLMMAEAFPDREVIGFDFHAAFIEEANAHAATHGLPNLRY
jgi:tRNA G46 methylase TrmB